jgi:signal transduction histidine kinase
LHAAFFRILQESLSNIARHAKTSPVRVELRQQGDC